MSRLEEIRERCKSGNCFACHDCRWLLAEVDRLRDLLKPFASTYDRYFSAATGVWADHPIAGGVTIADYRRAAAALQDAGEPNANPPL